MYSLTSKIILTLFLLAIFCLPAEAQSKRRSIKKTKHVTRRDKAVIKNLGPELGHDEAVDPLLSAAPDPSPHTVAHQIKYPIGVLYNTLDGVAGDSNLTAQVSTYINNVFMRDGSASLVSRDDLLLIYAEFNLTEAEIINYPLQTNIISQQLKGLLLFGYNSSSEKITIVPRYLRFVPLEVYNLPEIETNKAEFKTAVSDLAKLLLTNLQGLIGEDSEQGGQSSNAEQEYLAAEDASLELRHQMALKYLQRAIALDNTHTKSYVLMAKTILSINAKDVDRATRILEHAITRNPKNSRLLFELASIYQRYKNRDLAIFYYNQVLSVAASSKEGELSKNMLKILEKGNF